MLIDHIVLIVTDIKRTTKFYSSFLGKPEAGSEHSVNYIVDGTKLFFVLPYKKIKNNVFQSDRVGLNHLAFRVNDLQELKNIMKKLDTAKIKHSGNKKNKYSKKEYIWFDDPDGIRLEFYLR